MPRNPFWMAKSAWTAMPVILAFAPPDREGGRLEAHGGARDREAARPSRALTSERGGWGPFEPPRAGARSRSGPAGPGRDERMGGLGGPFQAPHEIITPWTSR